MSFLINPYAFLAAGGDFESIATVSVGSGGASSITFSSIPGTYQHLQVRGIARMSGSLSTGGNLSVRANGITTSVYAYHFLYGDGSSASAAAGSSQVQTFIQRMTTASQSSGVFGAFVMDILDYADINKNTTFRTLGGYDNNGSGRIDVDSGLYGQTTAVTQISFTPQSGTFDQYSTAALYGIKGA